MSKPDKPTAAQLAALRRLADRTLYVGMHVAFSTARALARKGWALHNSEPTNEGAHQWLRITPAGRAVLAAATEGRP